MAKKQKAAVSETITENIFRDFYGKKQFIEKSAIPDYYGFVSKNGTSYKGYPDFFRDDDYEDFVIIVEAKAENFVAACKEVKFYAKNNEIEKDIVGIAISGQTEDSYKAALFIAIKGKSLKEIETNGKLLNLSDIIKAYRKEKYGEATPTEILKKSLKEINEKCHSYGIKDTERSLFFSGLMIALKDSNFASIYKSIQKPSKEEQDSSDYILIEAHNLNLSILSAIVNQISNKINNLSKEYNWKDRFSFIKNIDIPLIEYKKLINEIEKNIFKNFQLDEKQDVLGRAYKIFLSRAGKVDNKNIILTPDHIKSLMVDLARLNVKDVVLDTCTGSGGFLMESMEQLIELAKGDSKTIKRITNHQLIGFETDPTLFALACSNMFLHGDGRTNLIFGNSLVSPEEEMFKEIKKLKATKCIINPPYERNQPILFLKTALDMIEPNGKVVIIMPTPTLNRNLGGLTNDILQMARLEFVIKMPNNLFSEQGRTVNTSIFGFTKQPHDKNDKVIFYYMGDDGLVSIQHKGRVDKYGKWEDIKNKVVSCINNNDDIDAPYTKRKIFDGDIVNCYGIKEDDGGLHSLVKLSELFYYENGSLQSENNEDGEYDFITASEEWKTHNDFDHECEALVFAVSAGGSLGRCHYVNGKFIASNLCLILTPKDNPNYPINLQFYSLYLNQIRKRLVLDLADGTSKLTINPEDLMDYYVEYVPKLTQDKIVEHYNETVLKAKEQYIKAQCDMNNVLASFV